MEDTNKLTESQLFEQVFQETNIKNWEVEYEEPYWMAISDKGRFKFLTAKEAASFAAHN